jgi:hypothetical protein
MQDKSEDFETHDIYLAAYLSIAGCNYQGKRQEGRRIFFKFTNSGGSIESLREAFYSNTGMVPAYKYSQSVIQYKQLCF